MFTYSQADLQAKKVPELKTILAGLGLSVTGVKADLVARVLEHQSGSGTSAAGETDLPAAGNRLGAIPAESELPSVAGNGAGAPSATEDTTSTQPAPTTSAAANNTTSSSEHAPANGAAVTEATAAASSAPKPLDAPEPQATSKESEAEKRAKRLARFGNTEELAKLQRAERFGSAADSVDDKSVSRLDSELSAKRVRTNDGAAVKAGGQKPATAAGAQKNGSSKPTSKAQAQDKKPVSKGGKPASKAAAAPAKPALSAEEEERRRKRAERFA